MRQIICTMILLSSLFIPAAWADNACERALTFTEVPLQAELALAQDLWPFVATYPFVDDEGREVLVVFFHKYPLTKHSALENYAHHYSLRERTLMLFHHHPDFYVFKEKDFNRFWKPFDFLSPQTRKAQYVAQLKKATGLREVSDAEIEASIDKAFATAMHHLETGEKVADRFADNPALQAKITAAAHEAFTRAAQKTFADSTPWREFPGLNAMRTAKFILLPFLTAPVLSDFDDAQQRETSASIHNLHLKWAIDVMGKLGYHSLVGQEVRRVMQQLLQDGHESPNWIYSIKNALRQEIKDKKLVSLCHKIQQLVEINPYSTWRQTVTSEKKVW